MEIVIVGPEDTTFNPHSTGRQPLEDWLKMHFEFVGPFKDQQAATAWVEGKAFDDDRYWAIMALSNPTEA